MKGKSDSPSFSSSGSFSTEPIICSCRWAWCRSIFYSNSELIHHVIHEHVRKSVAVPMHDIPMLRKAEEGIGESMSLTGMTGVSDIGGRSVRENDATEAVDRSLTLASIPVAQRQLSQSSLTIENPACPQASFETSEPMPQHAPNPHLFGSVVIEASPQNTEHDDGQLPTTPLPLRSQALPKPSFPESQYNTNPNPQGSSVLEVAPPTAGPFFPRNAISTQAFPSFASLSSPFGFTPFPSVPPSPSFQSQVSGRFRMGDAGGEDNLELAATPGLVIRNDIWSRTSRPSFSDGRPSAAAAMEQHEASQLLKISRNGSCERDEQQASQNADMGVNHDKDVDTSRNIVCNLQDNLASGTSSLPEQELRSPFPPEQGQTYSESLGSQTSSIDLISQRPFPTQQESQFQSQYQTQPHPRTPSLTESSSTSPPLALLSQAPRQTWYQVSSPYSTRLGSGRKKHKSSNVSGSETPLSPLHWKPNQK